MNLLAAVTFDGIGVDDLTWLAGLISVISVIVGAVWAMLRPIRAQLHRWEAFWDDWQGTPARPGHGEVPGVMQRLQSIDGELTRNGGNSLKDQVIGNSRKLDDLAEQNAAEHVALTDRIDAIQTEVRRWHASKEKPQ
jgi:hypothetical protein